MREITLIQDGDQEGNALGYDEITIIDMRVSRVLHLKELPNGKRFVPGDVYDYVVVAICDGKLTIIDDGDFSCLETFYKVKP
jgi:hypothetical protein